MLAEGVRIAGCVIKDVLIDIGLPEKYQQANRIASGRNDPAYVPNSSDAIGVGS
jgi:hypothetical protein